MRGLRETYRYFEEDQDEKTLKALTEEWANRMPGGHNTSYNYGWEKIKSPPTEWLIKMIRRAEWNIKESKKDIDLYKKELKR